MSHAIARVDQRGHGYVAVCECGHESEGPNPDTASKRHEIHEAINDARAALNRKEGAS